MHNHKAVVHWCETTLKSKGYCLLGTVEAVRLMLWSKVYRILTSEGYIYIKQMTTPFAIEAKLIHYLAGREQPALPTLIAYNEALLCFMMLDSGTTLRTILKQYYDIDIVTQGLVTYANIQQEMSQSLEALLALGVPDWRLQCLPRHYHALLSHEAWLLNDGLTAPELDDLKNTHSQFVEICEQLASYKIPETIEHCDFQDNNILLQQEFVTINDWADAVIAHPFFSLHSFLQSARRNHGFAENSTIDNALKNAYLHTWIDFESDQRLLEIYDLTKILHPIKFAMSFYRITLCVETEADNVELSEYKGTITQALRVFIDEMQTLKR